MIPQVYIFAASVVSLVLFTRFLKFPLPLALIAVSIVAALMAGFGIPFRHLVEGGFGYLNLVLALFAGAFFGQALQKSGTAAAFAGYTFNFLRGNSLLVLSFSAALLYAVGMFVGIAGVAVLATGVLVVPLLRLIGLESFRIGAFIAVVATCGMIAPPVNVPAMTIADGVNMPYLGFEPILLVLSVPSVIFMIVQAALSLRKSPKPTAAPVLDRRLALYGLVCLAVSLGFWAVLRAFPALVPDPAPAIVLFIAGLLTLPTLDRRKLGDTLSSTFAGTPLVLAAVLVTVGILLQVMTLTGVRGWLVINSMSMPGFWIFVEMALIPLFGGVLTSIGTANVMGVPFAFALIHQDMILNVGALSAIAALSEFVPPTSIAAALATYVVGDTKLWPVIKGSLGGAIIIAVIALLVLIFAQNLSGLLVFESVKVLEH